MLSDLGTVLPKSKAIMNRAEMAGKRKARKLIRERIMEKTIATERKLKRKDSCLHSEIKWVYSVLLQKTGRSNSGQCKNPLPEIVGSHCQA